MKQSRSKELKYKRQFRKKGSMYKACITLGIPRTWKQQGQNTRKTEIIEKK